MSFTTSKKVENSQVLHWLHEAVEQLCPAQYEALLPPTGNEWKFLRTLLINTVVCYDLQLFSFPMIFRHVEKVFGYLKLKQTHFKAYIIGFNIIDVWMKQKYIFPFLVFKIQVNVLLLNKNVKHFFYVFLMDLICICFFLFT